MTFPEVLAIARDALVVGLLVVAWVLAAAIDAAQARIADTRAQVYTLVERVAKADDLAQLKRDARTYWPELFDAEGRS